MQRVEECEEKIGAMADKRSKKMKNHIVAAGDAAGNEMKKPKKPWH
jgi:hypothetical protein